VQKTLNNLGHACGPEDGGMGPNTHPCIRSFQKANDLGETGTVNEATYQTDARKAVTRPASHV
jgi:peptidoglycan hydrolase-like protein with peptidoglycan-binding domain